MYLLETIEGSKGERLTSAVLKYLFINSEEFRRLFLRRIDKDFTASNVPAFKNGVICFHERPALSGDGFIDLVVVADNCVLGIENKLWASLTVNQPSKYLPTLKELANERCGSEDAYKIIMLIPEQREREIRGALDCQKVPLSRRIILTWQSIMKDLQRVIQEETGEAAVVARSLQEFLGQRLGEVNLNADPLKLIGDVELGNAFQQDFLNKVRGVFDNPGRIRGGGKGSDMRWYGFSFDFVDVAIEWWRRPWFGFAEKNSGVRLIIQTQQEEFPYSTSFGFSEFSTPGDVRLNIIFDKSEDSIPAWKDKLRPVLDDLRKRFESHARAEGSGEDPAALNGN